MTASTALTQTVQRWRKLGLIYQPNGIMPGLVSHAANPVAQVLEDTRVKIYYSARDAENRSHIAWLIVDVLSPSKILEHSQAPVLSPGPAGAFDDSGVSMGCLLEQPEGTYLYYLGWNLGVTVPWRNSIGLAVCPTGSKTFEKYSSAPIFDRNPTDPFSLSYPWVLPDCDGYRMWHGSNLRWGAEQKDMDHVLKTAVSNDGIHWQPTGQIVVGIETPGEYAFSKPCVIRDKSGYHLWYSFRGSAYRIGYAFSKEGTHWQRLDHLMAFEPGPAGTWEDTAICYPCVFEVAGQRYLLYNGNAYGKTGFGLAVLEA